MTPSPKLPRISTWNKFNPVWWVQNADDPIPPDWYRPDETRRTMKWRFRNPFHNLTFYVIGIADKTHVRYGRYPEKIANPNSGWNFAIARRRIAFLPFLSYHRGKFDFYLGWRPRGNLGAKINFNAVRPPRSKPPENQSTLPSDKSALPDAGP
jgi:hypothetical protein